MGIKLSQILKGMDAATKLVTPGLTNSEYAKAALRFAEHNEENGILEKPALSVTVINATLQSSSHYVMTQSNEDAIAKLRNNIDRLLFDSEKAIADKVFENATQVRKTVLNERQTAVESLDKAVKAKQVKTAQNAAKKAVKAAKKAVKAANAIEESNKQDTGESKQA